MKALVVARRDETHGKVMTRDHIVVTVGGKVLGYRFSRIELTEPARTKIILDDNANLWYEQALLTRLEPGGEVVG